MTVKTIRWTAPTEHAAHMMAKEILSAMGLRIAVADVHGCDLIVRFA